MIVRKALFANGFRFRLHDKRLPGKPDLVFKKYKTVVFIHGCFWHGHENCKYFVVPKTRTAWWQQKINRNKELDVINMKMLKKMKWKVISIYECHLKKDKFNITIGKLINKLKND